MAAVYYSTRFIIFQLSLSYNGIPTGWSSSGFRTNLVSVTCDLYGSWISLARWRNKIPWWLVWSEYNLVLHLPSDVKLEYDFDYSFFTRSNVLLFKYWFSLLFMVCILLHFKNFTMIMHSTPMSYPVGFSHTCLWCNLAMGAHHRWESTWLIILVRIVWLGST